MAARDAKCCYVGVALKCFRNSVYNKLKKKHAQ